MNDFEKLQIQVGNWKETKKVCPLCKQKIFFIRVQGLNTCVNSKCSNYGCGL